MPDATQATPSNAPSDTYDNPPLSPEGGLWFIASPLSPLTPNDADFSPRLSLKPPYLPALIPGWRRAALLRLPLGYLPAFRLE